MWIWAEIKIEWLDEFINKIDTPWEIKEALERWIKKIIFFAEWEAKIFTPVDKWFLRNSYRQAYWNLMWRLFNIRNYWIFVHEWTRFIKSNPFMTETVDKNKTDFNEIMNEELNDSLSLLKQ